ncbi:hypothetical protein COU18_00160 [Candidatus Kaiserbacteria bacterium CG10_big_fil_rev_8_21_14_0_10_51_14]|uniref:Uncharacterized protein n=1 Tax=Candidatus Kaiserbacteria bacterium CG10_big_fil_rev_8_21_14_0_10_51_14 TaxID=1974610 RepID=A0A2H0UCN7_9BACT|nr:MAG: hypothetical protein COU18_00160 [Candidatus Kaiserbacteria bacterium CG10_big_fil_rev_8_21_14_0_10_51_14]
MLSLFPEIMFLAPAGVFLIRIALGCVFVYAAWRHVAQKDIAVRISGIVESLVAAALIAGAWTQAAALAALLITVVHFAVRRLRTASLGTALLSLVMSLSLIVMGAGIFAFDLPL